MVMTFDTSRVRQRPRDGWLPGEWILSTDRLLCPFCPWVFVLVGLPAPRRYAFRLLHGVLRSTVFSYVMPVVAGLARALALPVPIPRHPPRTLPGSLCRSASRASRCNTTPPSLPILANSGSLKCHTCATASPLDLPTGPPVPCRVPGLITPPLWQTFPSPSVPALGQLSIVFCVCVPRRLIGVPARCVDTASARPPILGLRARTN